METHYTTSDAPKKWDQLHRRIGLIAQESSFSHWLIFEMFRLILKMDRDEASGLYYTLRADTAQRDLTLVVLSDRLKSVSELELLGRIKSAFDIVGRCSGRRNGFIHTSWAMEFGTQEFVPGSGMKLHPKLRPTDILGQAGDLIDELVDINRTLLSLCDELEELLSLQKST